MGSRLPAPASYAKAGLPPGQTRPPPAFPLPCPGARATPRGGGPGRAPMVGRGLWWAGGPIARRSWWETQSAARGPQAPLARAPCLPAEHHSLRRQGRPAPLPCPGRAWGPPCRLAPQPAAPAPGLGAALPLALPLALPMPCRRPSGAAQAWAPRPLAPPPAKALACMGRHAPPWRHARGPGAALPGARTCASFN